MISLRRVKYCTLIVVFIACLTLALSSTTMAEKSLQQHSEELAALVEQINPSVVSISVKGRDIDPPKLQNRGDIPQMEEFFRQFYGPRENRPFDLRKDREGWQLKVLPRSGEVERRGVGTGIIIDRDGHIVTTSHVVDDKDGKIKVRLADKREFEAKLVGVDKDSGVAVIKIDAQNLIPAKLANSDNIRVGELVLAFGNFRQMGVTMSMGIVSATGVSGLGIATYENFIQTDARIAPGSGGGPLVNAQGEVIGMIIAGSVEQAGPMDTGFAVPANTVMMVIDALVKDGKVARGWLGVMIQEVSAELAEKMKLKEPMGALVVKSTGPAAEGGIEDGDVIIEFDGKTIEDSADLRNTVALTKPGREVAVVVMRRGERKTLTVKVMERSEEAISDLNIEQGMTPEKTGWTGIATQELTRELAEKFGYKDEKGVLISYVRSDSPAHKAGLQNGDLIQEIEGKSISSMKDYEQAMEGAEKSLLMRIRSGNQVRYIVIKAKEK